MKHPWWHFVAGAFSIFGLLCVPIIFSWLVWETEPTAPQVQRLAPAVAITAPRQAQRLGQSVSEGRAFEHFWFHTRTARVRCGPAIMIVKWIGNRASEKHVSCTLIADYQIVKIIPKPGATATPMPTVAPTLIPYPTPVPTATSSQPDATSCNAGYNCTGYMLAVINEARARNGLRPYRENAKQDGCSYQHSVHMAQIGYISHDQFPGDVCIPWSSVGENVGMSGGRSQADGLKSVFDQMMAEPYTPGCTGNHHCSLLSSVYNTIGIGIYSGGGSVWVTENFIG